MTTLTPIRTSPVSSCVIEHWPAGVPYPIYDWFFGDQRDLVGVNDPITFARASSDTQINSSSKLRALTDDIAAFPFDGIGGSLGFRLQGTRTDKNTLRNIGVVSTTGMIGPIPGTSSAPLTVVDDQAELEAAGLGDLSLNAVGNYNVYKIDNSTGTTVEGYTSSGTTGNTNTHTSSVWARGSGDFRVRNSSAAGSLVSLTGSYQRHYETLTPVTTTTTWRIDVGIGAVVYFILFEMEEGAFVSSEILNKTGGSTSTRAADVSEWALPMDVTSGWIACVFRSPISTAGNRFERIYEIKKDGVSDYIRALGNGTNAMVPQAQISAVNEFSPANNTWSADTRYVSVFSWGGITKFIHQITGGSLQTSNSGTVPTFDAGDIMHFGTSFTANRELCGTLERLMFQPNGTLDSDQVSALVTSL